MSDPWHLPFRPESVCSEKGDPIVGVDYVKLPRPFFDHFGRKPRECFGFVQNVSGGQVFGPGLIRSAARG